MNVGVKKGAGMSIKPVNLFSNFKTTNAAATNPQQVRNNTDESGKSNKKAIIGGLAALAFAGTVATVAIKRRKVPDEVQSALNNFKATNETVNTFVESTHKEINEIVGNAQRQIDEAVESAKKQADEIAKNVQKLIDETMELYRKGDEIAPDGRILRKITGDDTRKLMEEFSQDGKIIRQSRFINDKPITIREGYLETNGNFSKHLFFKDGKPKWYAEGYEEFNDGSRKYIKTVLFADGEPKIYSEDRQKFANGAEKCLKQVFLTNRKPTEYTEGYERFADKSQNIAKKIYFKHGYPDRYMEECQRLSNGSEKCLKTIDFTCGKPKSFKNGYEKLADGTEKIAKQYILTDKGWQEITQ